MGIDAVYTLIGVEMPKLLARRSFRIVVAVAVVGGIYACDDHVTSPDEPTASSVNDELVATGVVVNSLWQTTGSTVNYVGTAATNVSVGKESDAFRLTRSSVSQPPLSATEIESRRSGLFRTTVVANGLAGLNGAIPGRSRSVAPRPDAQGTRPARKFRQFEEGIPHFPGTLRTELQHFRSKDGKDIALQFVVGRRNDGRPPVAAMISSGNRPIAMILYSYRQQSGQWNVKGTRTVMYDGSGKSVLMAENDLSALTFAARGSAAKVKTQTRRRPVGTAAWKDEARQLGSFLATIVQPDALYAAEAGKCLREKILLAAAVTGEAACVVLLAAAYASCVPSPETCVLAVAGAQLALAAADIALGVAIADLYNCQHSCGIASSTIGTSANELAFASSASDDAGWSALALAA
jgi:hypothetical protein